MSTRAVPDTLSAENRFWSFPPTQRIQPGGTATPMRQANPDLFFTRNDPGDPRMGDLVLHGSDVVPASARVAFIGVPQEIGIVRNGGRPGAAAGPDAIRAMFYRLTPFNLDSGTSVPADAVIDLGDIECDGELEEIHDRLEQVVADARARGIFPIVLGGGHDITYPSARGGIGPGGLGGLVNVDAHLDVRPPSPLRNSGTSVRMLVEEGTVDGGRLVEFGIQSHANAQGHVEWLGAAGGTIVRLETVRATGFEEGFAAALEMAAMNGSDIHATLDIDGVIGASAPGVSAVMSDGLSPGEFLHAARMIGCHPSVVSFDIAELSPAFDRDGITARLAARAVMEVVAGRLLR